MVPGLREGQTRSPRQLLRLAAAVEVAVEEGGGQLVLHPKMDSQLKEHCLGCRPGVTGRPQVGDRICCPRAPAHEAPRLLIGTFQTVGAVARAPFAGLGHFHPCLKMMVDRYCHA